MQATGFLLMVQKSLHRLSPGASLEGSGQHFIRPAIVGFLDRNYRYKPTTTQIPHDSGFALIPYSSQRGNCILTN